MTLPKIDAAFSGPYGKYSATQSMTRGRCRETDVAAAQSMVPARSPASSRLWPVLSIGMAGLLVLSLVDVVLGDQRALGQQPVTAYRGATIETMSTAGRIENATIVVRGESIDAVGVDIPIPETARIVDVSGMTILPGCVDPYRVVNIATDGAAAETTRTIVIGGRTFVFPSRGAITSTSFARVADSFYPYNDQIRQHLRSGITTFNLVTAGHGQAAIARVLPDQPESMIVNPDGILFASLTNQTASLDVVRNNLALVARRPTPTTSGSQSSSSSATSPRGPGGSNEAAGSGSTVGASRELWQKVHDGESPLLINANNAATILHLLKLMEPYPKVQVVLVATGGSVFRALDQLKGRNVSLILRPTIDLVPNSRERVCVPCLAHNAGVHFGFSLGLFASDLTSSQDAPLFPIAYLVRYGLPRQVALEALTIRPAKMLGIDKSVGSLESGKSANLVVYDGDPLDPGSQLQQVIIAGNTVYENAPRKN